MKLILFLSLLILIAAKPFNFEQNSLYGWSFNGDCGNKSKSDDSGSYSIATCKAHGELKTDNNGDCKLAIYDYKKITVTPMAGTEDPNNGKEICTQQRCDDVNSRSEVQCDVVLSAEKLNDVRAVGNVKL